MLALESGARVHLQHLSCAESVELLRLARRLGAARLTAELTPQHFSLTEDAVLDLGALAKINPPLRTERDRQALIAALKDGTIDMIATDHAPHSAEEKAGPFAKAPSGIIGLETALALGIANLVLPGHLSLGELIGKMTLAPAALYGLEAGFLAEGGPADIAIIDESETWTVAGFASKSSNSPFIGQTLTGRVKYTISAGKIVWQDGGE
jgi:dihydroorotase